MDFITGVSVKRVMITRLGNKLLSFSFRPEISQRLQKLNTCVKKNSLPDQKSS